MFKSSAILENQLLSNHLNCPPLGTFESVLSVLPSVAFQLLAVFSFDDLVPSLRFPIFWYQFHRNCSIFGGVIDVCILVGPLHHVELCPMKSSKLYLKHCPNRSAPCCAQHHTARSRRPRLWQDMSRQSPFLVLVLRWGTRRGTKIPGNRGNITRTPQTEREREMARSTRTIMKLVY